MYSGVRLNGSICYRETLDYIFDRCHSFLLLSDLWASNPSLNASHCKHVHVSLFVLQVSARLRSASIPPSEDFIAAEDIKDHISCRSVAKRDSGNVTAC